MTGVGKTQLADRLARRTVRGRRRRGRLRGHGAPDPPLAPAAGLPVPRGARRQRGDAAVAPSTRSSTTSPSTGSSTWSPTATPRRGGWPARPAMATATREEQLAAELEDWAITAHRIASMAVRRDQPVWLVIAVTKTDLYADELDDVVALLLPGERLALRRQARRAAGPRRRREAVGRRAAGLEPGRRPLVGDLGEAGERDGGRPGAASRPAQRPRLSCRSWTPPPCWTVSSPRAASPAGRWRWSGTASSRSTTPPAPGTGPRRGPRTPS